MTAGGGAGIGSDEGSTRDTRGPRLKARALASRVAAPRRARFADLRHGDRDHHRVELPAGRRAGLRRLQRRGGLIIGSDGLIAPWLPLLAGGWSDALDTRLGGRLPFVLAGVPVMMGLVDSLGLAALVVAVFFIGYFLAYEPYRALYPDLLEDSVAGRAQSAQAVARGIGAFLALVTGGGLLAIATPLPYSLGQSSLVIGAVAVIVLARADPRRHRDQRVLGTLRIYAGYAATWLVCSAAVLASLCFLRALARQQSDREQVRDSGEAS
jgi:MFS family permease